MSGTRPYAVLGELLLATGAITADELKNALQRQEKTRERLGEALVAMGVITEGDVAHALKVQARLRGRPGPERAFVLVVDDDPEVGAIVADILEGAGFCVGVAQDTAEATAALLAPDAVHPAAAVLDLGLPGDGGVELLARLRASEETRDLPVVILTGRPDLEQEIRQRGLHISALLAKPVPARRLVEVVEAAASEASAPVAAPAR
jgi:CheY-like chemotaxis protein